MGSLKIDGSIAMKSFTFQSIGSWFKSVIGQRFTSLSKSKEKLEVLYHDQQSGDKWRPLDEMIQLDVESYKAAPKRRYTEIPFTTPKPLSTAAAVATTSTAQLLEPPLQSSESQQLTLQLVPDEMIHHINKIFVHSAAEFFRTRDEEEFWNGSKPFPKHFLEEVDQW